MVSLDLEPSQLFKQSIGIRGQSRAEARAALAELGVKVSLQTIAGFRNKGRGYEGNGVINRLAYNQFQKIGNSDSKIAHYLDIGQTAVDSTLPQKRRPHRLSSEGLIDRVADKLHLAQVELRRRLRAIRADISESDRVKPDQRVRSMFSAMVHEYVNDYSKPKNDKNERVLTIAEEWRDPTIGSFYRILYIETNGPGIGTLVPYESRFISDYYQQLQQGGKSEFSPFDKFVLEAVTKSRTVQYADAFRRRTGIPIDDGVIRSHAAILTASGDGKGASN